MKLTILSLLRLKFVMLTVSIFSGGMGGVKSDDGHSCLVNSSDHVPAVALEIFRNFACIPIVYPSLDLRGSRLVNVYLCEF